MEITEIGFENFRVFKDYSEFDLAPITILTGTNSSGKSTVIKALKLLQSFWSQSGFGHHLDFEKGNHQLGNFEKCISKNSKENEIKITYRVNHILFDSPITIELLFLLNKDKSLNDVSLKNGILERMRIKLGQEIIYSLLIKENDFANGFNYKYILEKLLPKLKDNWSKLSKEFEKYDELLSKDAKSKDRADFQLFIPDRSERNFEQNNINRDRYYQLQDFLFIDFSKNFPEPEYRKAGEQISNDSEKTDGIENYKQYPYLYNMDILDLFSQIPKSESVFFIDAFWKLIIEIYPEIKKQFDYTTFKNFIEQEEEQGNLKINLWKDDFLLSGIDNFGKYLKTQVETATDEISKTLIGDPLKNIFDFNLSGEKKFYQTFRSGIMSATLWSPYVNSQFEETTQKAIINCDQIISDAIFLEQELFNQKPVFRFESALDMLKTFLSNVCKQIESDSKNLYFIDSIRATSQRFYSFDSQSSNFNYFITEFLKQSYSEKETDFLKKWLQAFNIAESCEIKLIEGSGSQVFLKKEDETINLVDLGYGVTQFLPILLKIIYCNNTRRKTIVIEEPETNLHPKFQSKLADLFVDAYKTFKIKFIVETHSEYLIRKLQYLTAKGEITSSETILYYIGNPDSSKREKGEKQIIKIQIEKNGQLSHPFGSGFTDESLKWLKAMFITNNN